MRYFGTHLHSKKAEERLPDLEHQKGGFSEHQIQNRGLQVKQCKGFPLYVWLLKQEEPSTDSLPIVTFVLRVLDSGYRQISTTEGIEATYRHHHAPEYYTWSVETLVEGAFFIEVEFLDMKINTGTGDPISFICAENTLQSYTQLGVLHGLNRMFEDGLHKDVTIETTTGIIKAHLAVLASRSSVFQAMFQHDLKESKTRTINIEDMTLEELKALLSYMYGTIKHDQFQKHRSLLLQASDKYDMKDLKELCEESLMEDINQGNVVERLQDASAYRLSRLKSECFRYLFDFGKVYDLQMELNNSLEKELIIEMFQEVLKKSRVP